MFLLYDNGIEFKKSVHVWANTCVSVEKERETDNIVRKSSMIQLLC